MELNGVRRFLTQKHEHQVELQSVGEAHGASQHGRERQAEQTALVKDGKGLDDGNSWRQQHQSQPPAATLSFNISSHTFSDDTQRVQRDPQAVSEPRQHGPVCADAGEHVERVPGTERGADEKSTTTRSDSGRRDRPEDLNGAPQVEDEEHHRFVLHLLQAAEDDEQNDVPSCHLKPSRPVSEAM